jgi:uncharacterized membrane protein YhaH (DUF805 family)
MASPLLSRFFSYRGRLSTGAFWTAGVALLAAFVVLFVFLETTVDRAATWALYPPLLWSAGALIVKRLHDRDRSAARLLLLAVPILGPLWLFVSTALRSGTPGENQYGEDPRMTDTDYFTVG